ncbi:MAG: winged helix-turn-helix domain-containing protein [Candidatus Korarchaeota archaeon]|nr:winged helix-turn-helix domain-containing protein [Candidatus Korarchaeota archaeon]
MRRSYRSQAAIILDLLEALSAHGVLGPSRLTQEVNLPHVRLREYLSHLLERGVIREVEVEGSRTGYELTEDGFRLLVELRRMKRLFDSLGLRL